MMIDDAKTIIAADLIKEEIELHPHAYVDGIERFRTRERHEPDRLLVRRASDGHGWTI